MALPLPEINDASSYDKMPGIGPHPKGIHHWWARLPLPTARAVLFASVVDDPSAHPDRFPTEESQAEERERLFDIARRMMGKKLHEHPEVYLEARDEMLKYCDGRLPTVFDPFAGGGSIPLEANRLGFEVQAADLNPVAVLLNRSTLELAARWLGRPPVNQPDRDRIGGMEGWRGTDGLVADLRYYAGVIHERATRKIGDLYPKVKLPKQYGGTENNVIAWIWARTVASPNPAAHGKHIPLLSTRMLSTKPGKMSWISTVLDGSANGWSPVVKSGDLQKDDLAKAKLGTKAGKAQDFICLLQKTPIQRSYIQAEGKAGRLGRRLVAIVAETSGGKLYLSPDAEHESVGNVVDDRVDEARSTFLAGSLPTRAEITGGVCTAYGLNTWGHLFWPRQIVALLTLSDLVKATAEDVRRDGLASGLPPDEADAYARAVATFLAFAVDRCADFNNALCRWSPGNQKVMNLFARQALPMVFDSAEANTLGDSVGAWTTCSGYVADCVKVLNSMRPRAGARVFQTDAATGSDWPRGLLVSTDPPYYHNISYATLSDFFYVWLRRALGAIHPDLFQTVLTPKLPELIASPDRFGGSKELAKEHFESGFRSAFTALRDRMDSRFPLTVYYAFKQDDEDPSADENADGTGNIDLTSGWETLLEALNSSGFQITATWPVRASQKWRMVSMGANALASYIVLACRPRPDDAAQTDRRSFIGYLKRDLPAALRHLQQGNIAPVDFAQAAIGPGMAIYSRYSQILESNGNAMTVRMALSIINQTLTEVLSQQEDDFDADTRWAISWFDHVGFEEGDFGNAQTLATAKNTSVKGMEQAGLLIAKGGRVRLIKAEALPSNWDPSKDKRLTVWEMTHHLLRVYYYEKAGDSAAADMLRAFGNEGFTARELAYRLFDLAEKRKLSNEAQAYNALVLGWPELARLVREGRSGPEQPGMFV